MIQGVVPHGGTWIEIISGGILWMRSLVVPHGGTWIEITHYITINCRKQSYLTEVRGLKFLISVFCIFGSRSYLTEVRGLKFLFGLVNKPLGDVVPHGGTWIEISMAMNTSRDLSSYLTEVRGLK